MLPTSMRTVGSRILDFLCTPLRLKTWISDAIFTRISVSIFLLIFSSAFSALMLSFATSCTMRGSSGKDGIGVQ